MTNLVVDIVSPHVARNIATGAASTSNGTAPTPRTDSSSFAPLIAHLIATVSDEVEWDVTQDGDHDTWINVSHQTIPVPDQGWKLHVSSGTPDAVDVLLRVVPILLEARVTFKLAKSLGALGTLNQGSAGFTQIGKFITVYPVDNVQAVELAVALDQATTGFSGPAVPTDQALAPGSLVHYRYGGFAGRYMQTPIGEILPAIVTPEGELVPDRRRAGLVAPEWAEDPFRAANVTVDPPHEAVPLIGGRFLVLSSLHSSPRGAVHLAFDTIEPRACVLKHARAGAGIDRQGHDSRDRLRYEAEILATLAEDERFPRVYGLHVFRDDLFLAMEDVAGKTLGDHIGEVTESGVPISGEQVIAMGRQLVSLVATLHARGLIFRDLKSSNVIVTASGSLRLIDFELVTALDSTDTDRYGYGTPGYMSAQQLRGERPTFADDVYGLGALLYLLATGSEPSQAMDKSNLLARPIQLLNPAIGSGLTAVIAKSLAVDPADRYATTAELDAALIAALPHASQPHPGFGAFPVDHDEAVARAESLELAQQLGKTIQAVSRAATDGTGRYWKSTHPQASGFISRDLNTGASGTVLALAELVNILDDPGLRTTLAEGARWLLTAPRPEGNPLPGLYVGEGSTGVALLRAGQVLGDFSLIEAAAERSHAISTIPFASPDLFNGTAGRIRFHLWVYEETKDVAHLQYAIRAGEWLLETAQHLSADEVSWVMPEGYGTLSGPVALSYAHGASGIADSLLDLFDVTNDHRFRDIAAGTARWVARQAHPILADGSGFAWPDMEGGSPITGFWCHGASGIGQFFLHVAQLDLLPRAWELAAGAARTTGQTVRFGGPTHCHGLAGSIEFLLDMYQATGNREYLGESRSLARLLEGFSRVHEGNLEYCNDFTDSFSPDYLLGYAGIAVTMLRLALPEDVPHQLSRSGFRYRG